MCAAFDENMKTKYKYLEFQLCPRITKRQKTDVWAVINHKTFQTLGSIQWDRGWRQYVFVTSECFYQWRFSRGCLKDMADFLDQVMAERELLRDLDRI